MSNLQYSSPKINAVAEQISAVDINSINLFWQDVERHGAPLIEEIEGDNENVLIIAKQNRI